jgi:hypothetical protein
MTAPAALSESKSTGRVQVRCRQAAAEGSTGLHSLELAPARHTTADLRDDLAERDTHRYFDQARANNHAR